MIKIFSIQEWNAAAIQLSIAWKIRIWSIHPIPFRPRMIFGIRDKELKKDNAKNTEEIGM